MKNILLLFSFLFANLFLFANNTSANEKFNLESDFFNGCLEAEYGQYPVNSVEPLCLGVVEEITGIGWAGEFSSVKVSNGTEYVFSSSVSTDYITIGNQNGTSVLAFGTGNLTWTSNFDGFIRFYTHVDSSCTSSNTSSRARLVQCGEILPPPTNDECTNAIALNCGDSGSGQTFSANDSGGRASNDVFFTYTGNGTPEFVTVSLCGSSFNTFIHVYSDCTLTHEIAYDDNSCNNSTPGDYSSKVSFTSDGVSTYVILVEGYSEAYLGNFIYEVSCTDVPPAPELCEDFEVLSNFGMESYFGVTAGQRLAFDLPIGDNSFSAYGLDINLFSEPNASISYIDFKIFDDNSGVPGNQLTTRTGTIVNSESIGIMFNTYPLRQYTVKFDSPLMFDSNRRYWVEVETDGIGVEYTSEYGSLGFADVQRSFMTGIWEPMENPQRNFVFNLICDEMGINDASQLAFSYYPNPVKDILNIHSSVNIREISIYNSLGQKISPNALSMNKKHINISSLSKGIYIFRLVLENGQVETFKIMKE